MAPIDLRNVTLLIKDGGSNFLQVKLGEGNLTFSERRNLEAIKSRGILDTVREGDEEVIDVNFQFVWTELTAANGMDPPTIPDALKRRGNASAWVSSNADSLAPYSTNLEFTNVPPCTGVKEEVVLLEWFNVQELAYSLKDGTIDCKGFCNVTEAILSRIDQP